MKSRYKAMLMSLAFVILFSCLFKIYGYENTFRLWNIPTMSPHFADLRVITHASDSYEQGFDPTIENPGDPWGRVLNYPRVWKLLHLVGINSTHTTCLGIMIICSFLIGVCLILPNASNIVILMVFAAMLSPSTLLGIERANIDLLMFFIISIAIVTANKKKIVSVIFIFMGFILKLYPVLAFVALLKSRKLKSLSYLLALLISVSIYAYITFSDFEQINQSTQKGIDISYGIDVYWLSLYLHNPATGIYVKHLSYALAFTILLVAFIAFIKSKKDLVTQVNDIYIDSFRVGAAIYSGTFLLGNNWDYRLIFLIFTIPQLFHWTRNGDAIIRFISKTVTLFIFISLWDLLLLELFWYFPYGRIMHFIVDEASNWVVFAGLTYLLASSMPRWIREFLLKYSSPKRLFASGSVHD